MRSARTRPMRASASSSARCLAATCSAGCACCSVQPPQTPKCGQRGMTRDAFAFTTDVTRAISNVGLTRTDAAWTRSPGSAPSTKIALPSTRATPRPSWSSESIVSSVVGERAEVAAMRAAESVRKRTKGRELYLCGVATQAGSGKIRRMRLLAFDTSTQWLSVACGAQDTWCVRGEPAGQAHSERLLPLIDAVLAESGWSLRSLDGIAFGAGPGSFTGVRIACGVAQGLEPGSGRAARAGVDARGAGARGVARTRGDARRGLPRCADARGVRRGL